ncbi:MAG: HAD-IIIA family hydrolase [bacterium]|nr:HAD-IIIA family hydrolase [bacterium]
MNQKRTVVILDRDGVLNADSPDYIKTPDELKVFAFAKKAVSDLRNNGCLIYIASNQSAIARGLTDEETLGKITDMLIAEIGPLDGIFYCPHHPDDACDCRKPKPGLLLEVIADAETKCEVGELWMVGDSPRDIFAGQAVGARTILVLSGHTDREYADTMTPPPDFICEDLGKAVGFITSVK